MAEQTGDIFGYDERVRELKETSIGESEVSMKCCTFSGQAR